VVCDWAWRSFKLRSGFPLWSPSLGFFINRSRPRKILRKNWLLDSISVPPPNSSDFKESCNMECWAPSAGETSLDIEVFVSDRGVAGGHCDLWCVNTGYFNVAAPVATVNTAPSPKPQKLWCLGFSCMTVGFRVRLKPNISHITQHKRSLVTSCSTHCSSIQ